MFRLGGGILRTNGRRIRSSEGLPWGKMCSQNRRPAVSLGAARPEVPAQDGALPVLRTSMHHSFPGSAALTDRATNERPLRLPIWGRRDGGAQPGLLAVNGFRPSDRVRRCPIALSASQSCDTHLVN